MKKINPKQLKKTYIIFLDLPIEVSSKIDLVWKKYNPKSVKKWPAHLTLKYEEDLSIDSEKRLSEIIDEFAENQKPIKLKTGDLKINEQENVGWNVYLAIKNSEIKDIVKNLSQKIEFGLDEKLKSSQWEQGGKYYPHISIKGGSDLKDSINFYNLIKQENLYFQESILCKTFTLAYWDNSHWQKVKTFKLGGNNEKTVPVSMSWGYPDLDDFPEDDFARICQSLAKQNSQNYLQYDPSIGLEKLRNLIIEEKISGAEIQNSENILITPGGTFSIFLTAYVFKNILNLQNIGLFLPCYDTALEIFKMLDFRIIDLNENLNSKMVDCLYLNSRYNNPTGLIIDNVSKERIEKMLAKNKIYAIEDDVYHIFNYSNNKKYKTFKDKYPDQVFYIDSFSKILAPGFRLGYMIPPQELMEKTAYLQKYICSSSSTLSQQLAYELMKSGKYRQIIGKLLKTYSGKMAVLERSLNKYGLEQYSKKVNGGFYKWIEIPRPLSNDLIQKLLEKNISVVDGSKYFLQPPKKHYIRLSIANIKLKEIDLAIKIFKEIIYENISK